MQNTTSTHRVGFRKVDTPGALRGDKVTATYAVLINGKTEGYVDKYIEYWSHHGGRQRKAVGWSWRRRGVPVDHSGYDRRSDAANEIVKLLTRDPEPTDH